MTRDELLEALTVERFAPLEAPDAARLRAEAELRERAAWVRTMHLPDPKETR